MTAHDIVSKIRLNTQTYIDYKINNEEPTSSQPNDITQLSIIQSLIDDGINIEVCNGPVFLTESRKGSKVKAHIGNTLEIKEDTKTVVFYMWFVVNHSGTYRVRYCEFDTVEQVVPIYRS